MIQANELRIGNWLEFDIYGSKWIGQIDHTDFEFIFDNDLRCANPIPLTEEWLLKFGFEQVYKSKMHSTYYLDGLSYSFWYDTKKQYANFRGVEFECEFAHELQNLFFALRKQELTLNN
jgi:hypothetical protein